MKILVRMAGQIGIEITCGAGLYHALVFWASVSEKRVRFVKVKDQW
jgi:hypothetical protein